MSSKKLLIDGCISVLGDLSARTDNLGSYPVMSKHWLIVQYVNIMMS